MSSVDLSRLPKVSFADTDAQGIEAAIINTYERLSGVTLQPGDPVRLFLEALAYEICVLNGLIDLAGKQNLLAYATGAHLDHLGALMGVARIPARNAICMLRFSMTEALSFAVPVPPGTRSASQDGSIVFATMYPAEIATGSLYVEIPAQSVSTGAKTSGLLPGQINTLLDPLPYIVAVANVTLTSNGSDIEDDERLRERIRLAPESYTVAGSSGQYEARVLEVDSSIETVSVYSPEPGVVDIRFVLSGGELPDEAMIELVREHLSAETVRPLTDNILVGAPDPVQYSIMGRWYLKRSDATMLSAITEQVNQALAEYIQWQKVKPGRDIVPDKLIALALQAGAKRIELDEPVFRRLRNVEIAREQTVEFVFGGLEAE